MARYQWIKRIARVAPTCPSCRQADWVPTLLEPVALLINPDTPFDHPELKYGGMDGKPVLPVTCKHCGYVATYSVQHLENVSPWEY